MIHDPKKKKPEDSNANNSDNKTEVIIQNDDKYVDYDNIDSDDDSYDETSENFKCQQCQYTCNVKNNLKKHVESEHKSSCDKCDFITSNEMHLKLHVKACHNKNELNKINEPKKRKSKANVVSKKVKKVKC